MTNYDFRALAREQMKDRYWMVFIATLIVTAIGASTSVVAVGLLLLGPLSVGLSYYLLDYIKNTNNGDRFELLVDGLKNSLATSIVAGILNFV